MEELRVMDAGRLDQVMQSLLDQPRNQIARFIKDVGVEIEGKRITKCGYRLKGGERLRYEIPVMHPSKPQEIDFDVEILYEDASLLVLNKPPFLVIHDAPSVKEPTLVDWLKHKGISLSTLSGEERHGIVHRIDKETSGALVIAKTNQAHQALSRQLQDRSMGRYYYAIIDLPLKEDCIVEKPIGRDPNRRTRMAVVPEGRASKSAFIKLALSKDEKHELIACKLFSGRTHQIRVHLASLSRHILGDKLYGFKSKKDTIPRVMLHAGLLYFIHPVSGERVEVRAPFFEDFQEQLTREFMKEKLDEILDDDALKRRFDRWTKRM